MGIFGTGMICVAGVIVVFLICGALFYQLRLKQLRGGWAREIFVKEFLLLQIPERVSGAVYDHYCRHSIFKSFRVRPDDSLWKVYAASHDEVDETALELCNQIGVSIPAESVLEQWPTALQTVSDMVLWLDWVRKQSTSLNDNSET